MAKLFSNRKYFDNISDEDITSYKFYVHTFNPFVEEFSYMGILRYSDGSSKHMSGSLIKESGVWKFVTFFIE